MGFQLGDILSDIFLAKLENRSPKDTNSHLRYFAATLAECNIDTSFI